MGTIMDWRLPPKGKGTGQKLSIAHSVIVQNHRGRLSFDTQWGAGTTFLIQLPLEQAEMP